MPKIMSIDSSCFKL